MPVLHMPVLETDRLRIRPLVADDLDACHALFEEIGGRDARPETERRRERRSWLAWQVSAYEWLTRLAQPPYGDRAIVLRAGEVLAGLVGLVPSFTAFGRFQAFGGDAAAPHSAEMGLFWALRPAHQGRGYATEAARAMARFAFRELHAGRIVATTDSDNERSQAVMRRLGMRVETLDPVPKDGPACVGVLRRVEGVS